MRNKVLDSLKFYAILIIYTGHFESLDLNGKSWWNRYGNTWLLLGISGKLCVALLGVVMCYLAYKSGLCKKKLFLEYSLNRYVYFLFAGLFINFIYFFYIGKMSFTHVLWTSVRLSAEIYDTFWCMRDFMIASILSYFLGYTKSKMSDVCVVEIILLLFGQTWVFICMLGVVIVFASQVLDKAFNDSSNRREVISLCLFMLSVFLIKICGNNENKYVFIIDGISSVLFVVSCLRSRWLGRIMNFGLTSYIGKYTMEIFLIHPICYETLGEKMLDEFQKRFNFEVSFFLAWILCFFIICLLAYPVSICLRKAYDAYLFVYKKVVIEGLSIR